MRKEVALSLLASITKVLNVAEADNYSLLDTADDDPEVIAECESQRENIEAARQAVNQLKQHFDPKISGKCCGCDRAGDCDETGHFYR